LHPQVRVDRPAVRRPHEEVLAVRDDLRDLPTGEVDVAEPTPPELSPHEGRTAQRGVEAGGREPQDVTFGHRTLLPAGARRSRPGPGPHAQPAWSQRETRRGER